jgi:hypothetical protein
VCVRVWWSLCWLLVRDNGLDLIISSTQASSTFHNYRGVTETTSMPTHVHSYRHRIPTAYRPAMAQSCSTCFVQRDLAHISETCEYWSLQTVITRHSHPQYLRHPKVDTEVVVLIESQTKVSIRGDVLDGRVYKLQIEILNHSCDGEVQFGVRKARSR